MLDRSGHLIAMPKMPLATAGMALSMWVIATGAGWPQAAPPQAAPSPSMSPPSTSSPSTLSPSTLSPSTSSPSLGLQTPAQQATPAQPAPAQGSPAPPSPPPVRQENPGLINEMGKLFDKSLSILPTLKSPGETLDDLNARAKDAGETLSRLATPAMVSGRMKCVVAANGAPDCKAAADRLCQTREFKEGKSLTTDSAETCSARVLIPGRVRKPDDCRTDNYVTRALCQ
jgi:hypothetical protein